MKKGRASCMLYAAFTLVALKASTGGFGEGFFLRRTAGPDGASSGAKFEIAIAALIERWPRVIREKNC